MLRFQSPGGPKASLRRRQVLIGAAALTLTACERPMLATASHTPKINMTKLNADVGEVAARVKPAVLGAGLMNLESGESWSYNGERPFPMQSVFKAPLGAAVLAEVDAGRLSLDEVVTLAANQLSPPWSPIANAWPGRTTYTVRELLVAAVGTSDNTAADLLMKRIGGPGAVDGWMQAKDVIEIRIDRYERELQPEIVGMASFRPAWKGEAFQRVRASIPADKRRAAMARYLRDPRDTATPRGMLGFLDKLEGGELLSPASTRLLLQIMADSPRGANRLRAGLPKGATLAHKAGTAGTDLGLNPATNDVGIFTLADGRKYAAAVFLSGSTLDDAGRDAVIAEVAHAMVRGIG
ncbi:MAG: class A beta-lactamase [Phenylobacterium sp.]